MCLHCNVLKPFFVQYHAGEKYTTLSSFWIWGWPKLFALVITLHAHVFSFTHSADVLSFGCVHPKNQTKILRYSNFDKPKHNIDTQDMK